MPGRITRSCWESSNAAPSPTWRGPGTLAGKRASGESVAKRIRLDIDVFGEKGVIATLRPPLDFDDFDKTYTTAMRDIPKGQSTQVRAIELTAMEKVVGFTPKTFHMLNA